MRAQLIILFLAAIAIRLLCLAIPGAANFSPVAAIFLCAAVFPLGRMFWLVPLANLLVGDIASAWYGHYSLVLNADYAVRLAGLGAVFFLGRIFNPSYFSVRYIPLLSVGGSLFFYLLTNTWAWHVDSFYAGNLAGWIQALTLGHPEYPSTLLFFRNTLVGDLCFSLAFALVYQASKSSAQTSYGTA